ncbi:MAG: hydroxyacid dehydrogenase [Planctomycetes bacterium]|nr:hydroxyacid dehydrogenase [Planctomycetota bacterium]
MRSGWKILVTAQAFAVSGGDARRELEAAGCEIVHSNSWGPLAEPDLVAQAHDIDAVIAATDPYVRSVFESLPNLKLVARCGVGIDSVNLADASTAGVLVTNVPFAMTDAVADYCMGLLLTMVRRIHEGYNCMRQGEWAEFPGVELRDKTLGLIGFGKIGQAVADRALGFGLRVIAFDPAVEPTSLPEWVTERYSHVAFHSLEEVLSQSHFVSVHAPNNPSTKHLINADTLKTMRPDGYLINTSRGALIDEIALIDCLTKGEIAGAAIDVYEREPLPPKHPLRTTPRLLLTPHNAFNSREAAIRMSWGCAYPILDAMQHKVPKFLCNRDVLESTILRSPIRK